MYLLSFCMSFTWHWVSVFCLFCQLNWFNLLQSCQRAHRLHFNAKRGRGGLDAIPEWKLLLTCRPRQFERKQARDVCVSGERWMTAAQRKWFRSLFQIQNQPFLQATAADINCGTCDFLLPAQIMIVWTTGALAPSPRCHRKRCWLWGPWGRGIISCFVNESSLLSAQHRRQS